MLKLNILCQSPVSDGMTDHKAIMNTIDLAIKAEEFGYNRFWVSEHHNTNSFASASPEIFISYLLSQTERLRIGTGGVLMSNYSPLKIAEQFNLLSTLYTGRIDLGIGRAGGADPITLKALGSQIFEEKDIFAKYDHLLAYLGRGNKHRSPFPQVKAKPQTDYKPEIWVLGTSPASALYAAENGLAYSFAAFINDEKMLPALKNYFEYFNPSEFLEKPKVNLGVFLICSENAKDAERLAKSSEVWLIKSFLHGENIRIPSIEDSVRYEVLPQEEFLLNTRRRNSIVGNPAQCINKLEELKSELQVDEFTIVTITHSHIDRIRSYELLMQQNT